MSLWQHHTHRGATVAHWREHFLTTNVARVQIPVSKPYVGWVCCWFSPLLWEVFSAYSGFSLSSKTNASEFQFDLERTNTFKRVLKSFSFLFTLFVWVLQFPPTSEGYQVVQERLSMTGAALNAAASDMVTASRGTSNQLAVSTKKFSLSYQDLLNSGLKLAGQAKVTILSWFIMGVLRFGVINLGFWGTAHLPLP